MKNERKSKKSESDMLPEYDFRNARPNPYAKSYASGTNIVALDRDNAKCFRDSDSVNRALRALRHAASAIPQQSKRVGRRKGAA